jgi:imidazolonepropionase
MSTVLIQNIARLGGLHAPDKIILAGTEMLEWPSISNAWLLIKDGFISDFGPMINSPERADQIIDAKMGMVLPGFVDSHSHLVFAGNRVQEFVDKINGLTYEEIAARGGGILNSAKSLAETNEEDLFEQSSIRLQEVIQQGTTAIEIKSGYGLTVEAELKILRVIRRLKETFDLQIKATCLAAHAIPAEFKNRKTAWVDLACERLIPRVVDEGLADYVDVFCEKNYFDVADMLRIMEIGEKFGLKAKVHVNQFNSLGGIQAACKAGALTVDHLEVMGDDDFNALTCSKTIATALPSCSFYLGIPYAPVKDLIRYGIPLALASDYNPGSSPSGNMSFVVSLACIKQKLLPEEALNAVTLNGAAAIELSNELGSISKGKRANVLITKPLPSWGAIPYEFGANPVRTVLIDGKVIQH